MNTEQIKQNIEKEQEALNKLYKKREEVNSKIKAKENAIERLKQTINTRVFDEAESVLSAKGLSLVDVLNAVKNGDLLSIQSKITAITDDLGEKGNNMSDKD